ncbi:MAG TPA: glycosyltransferase [Oligoflexia bacterium]|nr:glycosyltransferase [Oligoflexia bacterium]HMP26466.1 glycosyltransferase [Oligoflexia bacterium]
MLGNDAIVKPRIAWFSPSGESTDEQEKRYSLSKYFSDNLLPHLQEEFEIDLFASETGQIVVSRNPSSYHFLTARLRHLEKPYDLFVYNFEDEPECDFIRSHINLLPGIGIFHDFILKSDGPEPILNSGWREFLKIFLDSHECWFDLNKEHKKVSRHALRESAFNIVSLFTDPRMKVEHDHALASSIVDRVDAQKAYPRSYYIPWPINYRLNQQIKLPTKELLLAYNGNLAPDNRAHVLLEALCQPDSPPVRLVWFLNKKEVPKAQELLAEFPLIQVEFKFGSSPADWELVVANCDIAIHLSINPLRQFGPYLPISLAAGKPTLVSNFGAAHFWSEHLLFKISTGAREVSELSQVIKYINDHRQACFQKATSCAENIKNFFAAERAAEDLKAILRKFLPRSREILSLWREFELSARKNLGQRVAQRYARDPIWKILKENAEVKKRFYFTSVDE